MSGTGGSPLPNLNPSDKKPNLPVLFVHVFTPRLSQKLPKISSTGNEYAPIQYLFVLDTNFAFDRMSELLNVD